MDDVSGLFIMLLRLMNRHKNYLLSVFMHKEGNCNETFKKLMTNLSR